MPVYAITFRIADQNHGNYTYFDRYDSLVETINDLSAGNAWEEPTSFFLVDIKKPARTVRQHIENNAVLDPNNDLIFGFIVRSGLSFVIGEPEYPNILNPLRERIRPKQSVLATAS